MEQINRRVHLIQSISSDVRSFSSNPVLINKTPSASRTALVCGKPLDSLTILDSNQAKDCESVHLNTRSHQCCCFWQSHVSVSILNRNRVKDGESIYGPKISVLQVFLTVFVISTRHWCAVFRCCDV